MENFNWELLDNLMSLYMSLGVFVLILSCMCIGYFVYKVLSSCYASNEALNKKIRKNEIIETIKEINDNAKTKD